MKRFIAIFMTLCLVLGLSSVSVWAAEGDNEWQNEPDIPITNATIRNCGVCVIGDKIYTVGGSNSNSFFIYDTKNKTWETSKPMLESTNSTNAVAIGNKIYAIGSKGTNIYTNYSTVMQEYDLSTNEWTLKSNVPTFHTILDTVAIGDKMYVVYSNSPENKIRIAIFNSVTGEWTNSKTTSLTNRCQARVCVGGNSIYVVGDISSNISFEVYDTTTDIWTTLNAMPNARMWVAPVKVGNNIYAIGGHEGSTSNKVDIYDINQDSWTTGTPLKLPRTEAKAVLVDDKIYVIGGVVYTNDGTQKFNSMESLQVGGSSVISAKLSVLLNEGETVQLSTSYNLANNANYTWSSTNQAVATVDSNGKVTAVAEGTTDIYAQNADGTFKEYIPVKVTGLADEQRLAVHLKSGEKAKLYLTDDATQVAWSSMDNTIATITADGQVTGVKKGLAIVQAVLDGQTYQIYVRVNG